MSFASVCIKKEGVIQFYKFKNFKPKIYTYKHQKSRQVDLMLYHSKSPNFLQINTLLFSFLFFFFLIIYNPFV